MKLVSFDVENWSCVWGGGVANIRVNREKEGKGRPFESLRFGFVVAKESTLDIPLVQQFHRMSPEGIVFAWHTNRNRNTSPETWDQNGSGWWSKKKTERLQQQRFRATTCVVVLSLLGARRVKSCAFSSEDDDDRANVLSNEYSRG
ncbi:hypothetical protein HID58_021302 [Brassica napus]|uniref:DUF7912 domain-containing protein n=1 Tax=Brassica napus TaxID=3708 RepID=A0ABQ8CW18_BRANA|nr:hypothetical protein HID58_021302 [Brassica napus]